jgi:class 3 adenylate cyclase
VDEPETRYARNGDSHIAYQVTGDGPVDVVLVSRWISHVEAGWDHPLFARWRRRLASFSRCMNFDKRGVGLSDPVPMAALPVLEEWIDDIRVVMDAVDSEQAVLVTFFDSGPMAVMFAAAHPEQTRGLVLVNSFARLLAAPDYPHGISNETLAALLDRVEETWGTGAVLDGAAPSLAGDETFKNWFARYERLSASPGVAVALSRMAWGLDVRHLLPLVSVPTLVLQRTDIELLPIEHGRYLADHIPDARLVEFPGADLIPYVGDQEAFLSEIEEFVTGTRPVPEIDRILATVLFTDIVDSTKHAATQGDREWRDLLERHRTIVRRQIDRHRGKEIGTSGDGFLATFDGPARAIRCAQAIVDAVRALGLEVRAGLHTGECELMGDDVGGIAVHIGARVAALAGSGEVLVSSTVKDLVVGSGIEFDDRGTRELKGVPGEWHLFSVHS